MKKVPTKVKKVAKKVAAKRPRLTKEERDARKQKLQEERAAKKAERQAKREAKKQKEAEKKAAAKAKREERKAKKAARLQKQKERKAALKLKAKERAEAKKAREAARAEKKAARLAKKTEKVKVPRAKKVATEAKTSVQDKIEYERNEWKALSAIRRYVKDEAKAVSALDGDKLERKLKKLEKMGYEVLRGPDGKLLSVGYSFTADIKLGKVAKSETGGEVKVVKPKKTRTPRKPAEDQQPQDSAEPMVLPPAGEEAEEKLLTDEEILAAAEAEKQGSVDAILVGDAFKDEAEVAEDAEAAAAAGDEDEDKEDEDDEEEDETSPSDDTFGAGGDISREQADYRSEAFREMEANGAWD